MNMGGGEGGSRNLMPSSNLLKSKIPILWGWGGGGGWGEGGFMKFDAEFKLAKSKIPILCGWWGWGGGLWNLMLSSNFAKSQKFPWGGVAENYAEFKFAKIQKFPIFVGGGWGWGFTEFDAEFKFAKIQNSHFVGVGEWGKVGS